MYLEIFVADFAVFRVFWGISRDFAEISEFRGSATARNIRSPDNASKSKLLTLIKNNSYVQLFYKLSLSYSQFAFATNGSTSLLNENF